MEQIFRIGDTVYHWKYGEGKVIEIGGYSRYSVSVEFAKEFTERYIGHFTPDGLRSEDEPPTLSHTPYDLVNGGFSQRVPLPDIKKGTPVFVRDFEGDVWYLRVFSHFDENGKIHTFTDKVFIEDTLKWNMYSLENPIKYE